MVTRMIMKRTRRSCIFAAMLTCSFIFIFIQLLLNGANDGIYHYQPAILPDRFLNQAMRQAIYTCKENVLYQHEPARCQGNPFLLVLVASSPNHLEHRNLVRQYLNSRYNNSVYNEGSLWRIVFLISRTNNRHLEVKIKKEIEENRDILHGRFRDIYSNLVYKTLMGFGWAYCRCLPRYLLKTDDDVFLNLKIMVNWLLNKTAVKQMKAGVYRGIYSMNHQPRPIRDEENKYFVSKEDYPYDTYPPFVLGAGYLISQDVLKKIAVRLPQYHAFPVEDAYVALIISKIGVQPENDPRFLRQSKPHLWKVCDYRNFFLSHNSFVNDYAGMFIESRRSETECLPKIDLFRNESLSNASQIVT